MKYYDILWTYDDTIDNKIEIAFMHIKKEVNIAFKKEIVKNKHNAPRAFWFLEDQEKRLTQILELYPNVIEYFKEKEL